jgi:hypothetical protein
MRRANSTSNTAAKRSANRTKGGRFAKAAAPPAVHVAVTTRPQTAQEGRQFTAALDLLLAKFVREELDRGGKQS